MGRHVPDDVLALLHESYNMTRSLKRNADFMLGDDPVSAALCLEVDALYVRLGEYLWPDDGPPPEIEPEPVIETTATEAPCDFFAEGSGERYYRPRKGMVWTLSPPDPPSA